MNRFLLMSAATLMLSASWVQEVKAEESTEPITEQPAGTLTRYSQDAVGYELYSSMFDTPVYSFLEFMDNYTGKIVEGDDGYTYIYSPITGFDTNSWVRGERHGDSIVVKLPQPLCYLTDKEGNTELYTMTLFQYTPDEGVKNYSPMEGDEVVYTVTPEGHIILDLDYDESTMVDPNNLAQPMVMLGIADAEGKFAYSGVAYSDYTPAPGEFITVPEGAETKKYVMAADLYGRLIDWATDGNDVYMRGMCEVLPDAWVKGTAEDNTVTFKSWQLLGEYLNVWNYFIGGTFDPATNRLSIGDSITFNYDAETKTYTTDKGNAFFSNGGAMDHVAWTSMARDAIFKEPTENPVISLIDPQYVLWYPYGDMSMIVFDLANINKDNDLLDVNKLYYRLYLNNELETLYPDEYPGLTEEVTDIPWTLMDPYGFISYKKATHTVLYFSNGVETIGCQLVYKDGDQEYVSNITTYNINTGDVTTGIDSESITGAAPAVSTEYFDLQGRGVSSPEGGIYIKRTVREDGSVETSKIAK